jgi:hypothetical protein
MTRWRGWLPFLILCAAVIVLFYRLLLGEVIFWGLPLLQFYPWRSMAFAALRAGHLPLWNPLAGSGSPLLANYQSAIFYPPNWLYLIVPTEYAMGLVGVLHLLWAGLGMQLYLQRLGLDRFGQGVGAIGFALSGYLIARFAVLTIVSAAAWLPWLLWAVEGLTPPATLSTGGEAGERPSPSPLQGGGMGRGWHTALLLAGVVAMLLLAGHAQTAFYSLLLAGAYALWKLIASAQGQRVQRVALITGAVLLGAALAAVQLVPTAELMQQSQRADGVERQAALSYSFWPWHLLTLALPDFFGSPAAGDYSGYGVYWEDAVYVGLLTLALAGRAAGRWWRERRQPSRALRTAPFYAAISVPVFVLALGWNTPIFPWLFDHVPTFDLFNAPARWMILIVFGLCVLGATGADRWQVSPRGMFAARLALVGGAGIAAVAAAVQAVMGGAVEASMVRALLRLGAGVAILAGLVLLQRRAGDEPRRRARWEALALALLALDLVSAHRGLNPTIAAAYYHQRTPLANQIPAGTRALYLPADEYAAKFDVYLNLTDFMPDNRAHWDALRASLLPNLGMIDGIASASAFDPLQVGYHAVLLREVERLPEDERLERLRQMAVGAVLKARQDGTVEVALVDDPWPRAALAACADQGRALACERSGTGSAAIVVDEPERVVISVSAGAPAWLVLADTFYPGWTATLDSTPASIERANGAFRAVQVPAGEHEVAFTYRPASLRAGAAISGAALIVWVGLLVAAGRRRANRNHARSGGM